MSGTTRVVLHLARSPEVRTLVIRGIAKFCLAAILGTAVVIAIRWATDKPITEDLLASIAIGYAAIAAGLLVSALRTARAVMREHALLE